MRFYGAFLSADHSSHDGILHSVFERLGRFGEFLDEVVWHGFLDTLKLVLFLFLTYLFMEFIEHKATDKVKKTMTDAGRFGPLLGGIFGAVPQCGFSAVAANLYTARIITLGTLIAVFLSTSDEMLPILIAGNMKIGNILLIILYKCVVGVAIGFAIDISMRMMKIKVEEINIDEICDNDGCNCQRGIFLSALHHTVSVSAFILLVTVALNAVIFFIGDEALTASVLSAPVVSHVISAFLGLIPNCASSVALTRLCTSGVISVGAMLSGLFSGAGVGVLVLLRMNRRKKENALIIGILIITGILFGLLADAVGISLL